MDPNKYNIISIVIHKDQIIDFDFSSISETLFKLHETPRENYNKVTLIIDGYDDDSREIYQIQEIRDYMSFLDKSFPYWFYYLNIDIDKKYSPIGLIILCVCDIDDTTKKNGGNQVQLNIKSLQEFVLLHFDFMEQLMEQEKHSEKEITNRTKKVIELIS